MREKYTTGTQVHVRSTAHNNGGAEGSRCVRCVLACLVVLEAALYLCPQKQASLPAHHHPPSLAYEPMRHGDPTRCLACISAASPSHAGRAASTAR